jgi:two-component system response regulator
MANQKILIVDDSKTIRMQIKDMLPKGNFEVLEAQDGMEALDLIIQKRPNLILLDFFMPRMNGWEVVQKIQNHPKLHNIPVVMMSGRREDVEKAVPELFTYFEFLAKPFEADVLIKAIKIANGKARQRQQIPQVKLSQTPEKVNGYIPAKAPIPTSEAQTIAASQADSDDIQKLKAEVQKLTHQNAQLETKLESLRKQVHQILVFIRHKIKA